MAVPFHAPRARFALSLTLAGVAFATSVAPSSAAGPTPYNANFPTEQTVQRTCPAGVPTPPPGSTTPPPFCFTGTDHGDGTSTPPIPPDIKASEDFAGFVNFAEAQVGACAGGATGFTDHNVVTITTNQGRLFLTTLGLDCPNTGTDDGTWTAVGGTGIFSGATGSGHVHTQATGGTGTPTDPIRSASVYFGTLNLR